MPTTISGKVHLYLCTCSVIRLRTVYRYCSTTTTYDASTPPRRTLLRCPRSWRFGRNEENEGRLLLGNERVMMSIFPEHLCQSGHFDHLIRLARRRPRHSATLVPPAVRSLLLFVRCPYPSSRNKPSLARLHSRLCGPCPGSRVNCTTNEKHRQNKWLIERRGVPLLLLRRDSESLFETYCPR